MLNEDCITIDIFNYIILQ